LPPIAIIDQLQFAKDAIPAFTTFIETFQGAAGQVEDVCGTGPVLITAAADVVANILCKAGLLLRGVRVFMNCDNWYPLYEGIVYDTLCYTGTEGFAWVASTQFVIVFMTMIILTLRISFYEEDVVVMDKEEDKPGDDDSEYSDSHIAPAWASKDAPAAVDTTSQTDEHEEPQIEMVDSGVGEEEQEHQPI
jgi:hypothetical protein